jgi:hypothetical protein
MITVTAFTLWSPTSIEGSFRTQDSDGNVYTRPFSLDFSKKPLWAPTPADVANLLLDAVIETYQFAFDRSDRNLHGWSAPFVDSILDTAVFEFDFDGE